VKAGLPDNPAVAQDLQKKSLAAKAKAFFLSTAIGKADIDRVLALTYTARPLPRRTCIRMSLTNKGPGVWPCRECPWLQQKPCERE
ncbi:uncharacterized protein METZ01_LOCUS112782, partial [marine metagenome]